MNFYRSIKLKKNFRPKICVPVFSIFFKIRCWRRNYINGGKATKSSKAPHQNFQGNKMANFFAERQFICQRIIYEIPRLRTKKVTGLIENKRTINHIISRQHFSFPFEKLKLQIILQTLKKILYCTHIINFYPNPSIKQMLICYHLL